MEKTEAKYEVGQLVRLLDGDGRPHLIRDRTWQLPWREEFDGWWDYQLEGNVHSPESNLVPYIDKHLLGRIEKWMRENVLEFTKQSFSHEFDDCIDDFKNDMIGDTDRLLEEFGKKISEV